MIHDDRQHQGLHQLWTKVQSLFGQPRRSQSHGSHSFVYLVRSLPLACQLQPKQGLLRQSSYERWRWRRCPPIPLQQQVQRSYARQVPRRRAFLYVQRSAPRSIPCLASSSSLPQVWILYPVACRWPYWRVFSAQHQSWPWWKFFREVMPYWFLMVEN